MEHEQGFRAEFAYPKTLCVSPETLPVTVKEIQTRIQALVGYGCDIFISQDYSNVPLWRKGTGLDADGLDFLMSRGREWYARRMQERTIKKGDRIAVLGRGIASVRQITEEHVHAVLCNRSALQIQRKAIVWHKQNMRWEIMAFSSPSCAGRDRRHHGSLGTCRLP